MSEAGELPNLLDFARLPYRVLLIHLMMPTNKRVHRSDFG